VRTERAPDEIVLDIKLDWTKGKPQLFLGIKPRYSFALEIKVRTLISRSFTFETIYLSVSEVHSNVKKLARHPVES
jgi:hypothetical protein